MPWLTGLIQVSGRTRRRTYWIVTIVASLLLLTAAGLLLEERFIGNLPVVGIAVVFLVGALAVSLLASIRRLHDRNKSGWWMVLYGVVPTLFGPNADGSGPLIPGLPDSANSLLTILSVGLSLWAFIDLGILRGTQGPNRFGPDPKGAVAADVFD